ncbi:MAG: hypothetical protein IQL11_14095 [Bacteroidales bacterium]|nr:hypothetical protein [Bacteroidales bacterium]
MRFYIPPQLLRLGLAFVIFVTLFLFIRHSLVPESFGQYGFYRGEALGEIAGLPVRFAGQKACLECHQDIDELKQQDVHSDISCETCHGPGQIHSENGDTTLLEKPVDRESCGICHSKNKARQKDVVFQVDLKEHNVQKRCIECHYPHQPWSMKE